MSSATLSLTKIHGNKMSHLSGAPPSPRVTLVSLVSVLSHPIHLLTNLPPPVAQKERFAALAKFKSSVYRILIATDVASR